MIGEEDAHYTFEYDDHYKILPAINNWGSSQERIKDGKKVPSNFTYCSDNNEEWMTKSKLNEWLRLNNAKIGKI